MRIEALATLDLGDENSWKFRSLAINQMQPSVEYLLLISEKRRKTVSFKARPTPSEPIMILFDKEKKRERNTIRRGKKARLTFS